MKYATYLCTIGCVANCPCAVRATAAYVFEDADGVVVVERGGEYDEEPGLPCVVFRCDDEHPHPPKHLAVGDDGVFHEWADGDDRCRRYRPCPSCDGMDPACTLSVEVTE